MKRPGWMLGILICALGANVCGGGDDGPAAPVANLSGDWEITATSTSTSCGMSTGEVQTIVMSVAQADGSNTLTLDAAEYGTTEGTIDGDQVSFSFATPTEDCTSLSVAMNLTVDSTGSSATGSGSFTCAYPGGSCGNQFTVTATMISGGASTSGLAAQLCSKFESCGFSDSSMMGSCEAAVSAMTMYVVDPSSVGACLSSGTCEQILDEAFIEQCLAYDTASFQCNGNTLHVCNTSSECKEIDCAQACQQVVPGSSSSCGLDSDDQYDKCICSVYY